MRESLSLGAQDTVDGILSIAREMLGMDLAYLSEFDAGVQRVQQVEGDAASFGIEPGTEIPLEQTFCQRMVAGVIPNAVGDVRRMPALDELEAAREAGIRAYVGVPVILPGGHLYGTLCCADHDARHFGELEVRFLRLLARLIAHWIEREEESVRFAHLKARADALDALVASLEARDAYTGDHSACVVQLAAACTSALGCPDDTAADIGEVARLHDIGKVGIPDAILTKPGRLNHAEWAVMRRHPVIGEQIIGSVGSLRHLAPAVRAEHERYDGRGYPDGLAGEDIPLASRIVLACDAYHAMMSDRPYRRSLGPRSAIRELEANAGSQFDPDVVETLLAVLRQESVAELGPIPPPRGRPV